MSKPADNIDHSRRRFLQRGLSCSAVLALGAMPVACGTANRENETRILVPEGMEPRIIAYSGKRVSGDNSHKWHSGPDGGGVLGLNDGGWIYVSNGETRSGSVSTLRFDSNGTIVDSYPILQASRQNCSGTITPWQTWLSCEEVSDGIVWECDPFGIKDAKQRLVLGVFQHESACIDPDSLEIYLTEDKSDGRLYRFTPDDINVPTDQVLDNGRLEVARVVKGFVDWLPIDDPLAINQKTRYQQPKSRAFDGGEGICYDNGFVYFTTEGDNRIWALDIANARLKKLYNADGIMHDVDDIITTANGDLLVSEDGPGMRIVCFPVSSQPPKTIVQIPDHGGSEITGLAFDPSYSRLYFNSQKGNTGLRKHGLSFELSGNFDSSSLSAPLVEWTLAHAS